MARTATRCLAVVMPCYNEAATVGEAIERVLASPFTAELVVVDDGSTDGTAGVLRGIADPRVRVLTQPRNRGKGAALRRGFAAGLRAPFVLVQDADLEYDPAEYSRLLEPLLDDRADVVFSSRFGDAEPRRVLYFWHAVGNRFISTLSNAFTNLNLTDIESCYKTFRREVLEHIEIEEDGFGVEPELTAKVAAAGCRIYEVGVSYSGRTYAEGKKITWRDGVEAMRCIVRYSAVGSRLSDRRRTPPPAAFDDADEALGDVLRSLSGADNYNDWVYSLLEPHLGKRVLEVGAGHGAITERLADGRTVDATDLSTQMVTTLQDRLGDREGLRIFQSDLETSARSGPYDTIVLVNVLEHIEDDRTALHTLLEALEPGGRLLLFVPALRQLYSDFDRRIGHYRRYDRRGLLDVAHAGGFQPLEIRYVNALGVVSWWFVTKKLGRVPTTDGLVRIYDRYGVPIVRQLERRRAAPIGQSLFAVLERPALTARSRSGTDLR